MHDLEEQWIQSASGLWMPKQQGNPKKRPFSEQPGAQNVQLDPEPQRDWKAYWETRGQAWRWEPEIDQERQQFLLKRLDESHEEQYIFPFRGITLSRADIEWLVGGEQRNALDLREAILNDVDLHSLSLKGANFGSTKLEGANFVSAKLKGANFGSAKLEGAYFGSTKLEGADLRRARLEKSDFEGARLGNIHGEGPRVADALGWEAVYLAAMEWSQLRVLGDEAEAHKKHDAQGKKKGKKVRFKEYSAATRAYRQLATALEGQGLKEDAERFAYRAQVMQRKVWWWSLRQERGKQQSWRRFLGERANGLGAYLFSSLLGLLTGYGYRFGRSLVSYLCVLGVFALLYWHISQETKQPLEGIDALILSISDMVGRGFFRQDIPTYLNDPYAGWSVLEGMVGVFMDVLLISTLTQRLFKK